MELTELLLYRGNFGFNWRLSGGRAGVDGGGNGVTRSVFWKDHLKGESEEKNERGLDVWEEVLCLCVYTREKLPIFQKRLRCLLGVRKQIRSGPGQRGFNSHFESIMTDPWVLSARITE